MSAARAWYITCDGLPGQGCGTPAQVATESLKAARAIAAAEGYHRVLLDGKWRDLCGYCYRDHLAALATDADGGKS